MLLICTVPAQVGNLSDSPDGELLPSPSMSFSVPCRSGDVQSLAPMTVGDGGSRDRNSNEQPNVVYIIFK